MKKNKMITILFSFVAALACAGLAVSAAQTENDNSSLTDESYVESSIVIDENSATEPLPIEYDINKAENHVYITEEERKAQASNVLEELNTKQDCNSGNDLDRKRARAIQKRQAEAK